MAEQVRFECFSPAGTRAAELRERGDVKLVQFMRHGEAANQVRRAEAIAAGNPCRCHELAVADPARERCPYRDPELVDAPLTDRGREQVRSAAAASGAELVLTSTLSRAVETALLAFEALPAPQRPPVVALDALRPKVSYHMHSKRSALSLLGARFPAADFTGVADEEDLLWTPDPETRLSLDARASAFLRVLSGRPERSVVVVTHFTMLFALFSDAAETLLVGTNPERPVHDPAFLDCVDCDDDNPVKRFLIPAKLRGFLLVPA